MKKRRHFGRAFALVGRLYRFVTASGWHTLSSPESWLEYVTGAELLEAERKRGRIHLFLLVALFMVPGLTSTISVVLIAAYVCICSATLYESWKVQPIVKLLERYTSFPESYLIFASSITLDRNLLSKALEQCHFDQVLQADPIKLFRRRRVNEEIDYSAWSDAVHQSGDETRLVDSHLDSLAAAWNTLASSTDTDTHDWQSMRDLLRSTSTADNGYKSAIGSHKASSDEFIQKLHALHKQLLLTKLALQGPFTKQDIATAQTEIDHLAELPRPEQVKHVGKTLLAVVQPYQMYNPGDHQPVSIRRTQG